VKDERNDWRERRRQLQTLDAVLLAEFDLAGALAQPDLVQACRESPVTSRINIDAETLGEWWDYSKRRQILEPMPAERKVKEGELVLTEKGERRLHDATRELSLDTGFERQAVGRLLSFALPSVAGVATVVAAFNNDPEVIAIGLAVLGAVLLALLVSWGLRSITEPVWQRYLVSHQLRMAARWLAGVQITGLFGKERLAKRKPVRLPSQSGAIDVGHSQPPAG
jgi:hypothetical protein